MALHFSRNNSDEEIIEGFMKHEIVEWSKITPLLKIRYNYYKSFYRVISYDDIKAMDPSFNPQRRRFMSYDMFDSISTLGSQSA